MHTPVMTLGLNSAYCKQCCWASSNLVFNVTHSALSNDDRGKRIKMDTNVKLYENIVKALKGNVRTVKEILMHIYANYDTFKNIIQIY